LLEKNKKQTNNQPKTQNRNEAEVIDADLVIIEDAHETQR